MDFNDLKNNLNTLNKEARIDELEKLKSEFLQKCKEYYRFDNEIILNGFIELIDNRIMELEGDNNETNN